MRFNWYRMDRMNVDIILTVSSLQMSSPRCAVWGPIWQTAPASSITTPTSAQWRPRARPRSSPSCPEPRESSQNMRWPRVIMARPPSCPPTQSPPLSASITPPWRPLLSPSRRGHRPQRSEGGGRGQWPRRCGGRGWRRSVTLRGCRAPSLRTPWWRLSRPGSTIKIIRWAHCSVVKHG